MLSPGNAGKLTITELQEVKEPFSALFACPTFVGKFLIQGSCHFCPRITANERSNLAQVVFFLSKWIFTCLVQFNFDAILLNIIWNSYQHHFNTLQTASYFLTDLYINGRSLVLPPWTSSPDHYFVNISQFSHINSFLLFLYFKVADYNGGRWPEFCAEKMINLLLGQRELP